MARTFSNSTQSIRDFEKWLSKGKEVWVIHEHANLPAQFERYTCSRYVCTGRHPLLGHWEIGANVSAKSFLREHKQVFDKQPHGIRDLASPEPDCRSEGQGGMAGEISELTGPEFRTLDDMELGAMAAAVRYGEDRKSGRRKWGLR